MSQSGRPNETRMQMFYGVNQADQCADFAIGPARKRIHQQLRDIDTRIIRLFVFDKSAPDPVTEWPTFASYIQAVLDVGAVPMLTFAKLRRPLDDPRAIRWFTNQCGDVVWNCIEQWGGEAVRNWYWCVWNEPNNSWISGPVTFEQYRRVYEDVARITLRWLGPYLNGSKALIGGPAIEGFQPFWWDWAWRFVNEIDNQLIGFLDWHRYADWRNYGENGAPTDAATYEGLMMSQAADYEDRGRAIGRLLQGRDILNICGELNTHSHYTESVRAHFNQGMFGAAFYTTAVLHLMRAGVYAEMFWTGNEDQGGYGMLNKHGDPWPVFYAKKLCAQYVRRGDWISFPASERMVRDVDVVLARAEDGRQSALLVHLKGGTATYNLAELGCGSPDFRRLLKIDGSTGNAIVDRPFDGHVHFEGYGVAVVTSRANHATAT